MSIRRLFHRTSARLAAASLPFVVIAAWAAGWTAALVAAGLAIVLVAIERSAAARDLRRLRAALSGVSARAASAQPEDAVGRRSEERAVAVQAADPSAGGLDGLPAAIAEAVHPLVDRQRRLEIVLEAIPSGVIALDAEGRVALLNRAAELLFAVPPGQWTGRKLEDVCRNTALVDLARDALRGEAVRNPTQLPEESKILEVYISHFDGPTRLVLVLSDVSEVCRLETVRRDFAANVSHELKTPLTAIQAYVETLIDGGLSDPEVNLRFTRKIESNAARLATLITDLLSLSRIESGKAITQRSRLNLAKIISDSFHSLRSVAEKKQIAMELELPEKRLEVVGEAEALRQTFNNLIDNACKYTEVGGSVRVSAWNEPGRVVAEISDTGIGIPEEDLPRIFERFYRVDKARSREKGGTGLGLSIVKHYVEALEGEIEVQSRLGVGSTFRVKLPRAEAPVVEGSAVERR